MAFWNRLQKSFPRNRYSLKAENLVIEVIFSVGLLLVIQKRGPDPSRKEKTFKELHQPRTLSYRRDNDAPEELP